jgi:hypothetical protein
MICGVGFIGRLKLRDGYDRLQVLRATIALGAPYKNTQWLNGKSIEWNSATLKSLQESRIVINNSD